MKPKYKHRIGAVQGTGPELVELIRSTILGHRSHWQESIISVDRDELLATVAVHVIYNVEKFLYGSITQWGETGVSKTQEEE